MDKKTRSINGKVRQLCFMLLFFLFFQKTWTPTPPPPRNFIVYFPKKKTPNLSFLETDTSEQIPKMQYM